MLKMSAKGGSAFGGQTKIKIFLGLLSLLLQFSIFFAPTFAQSQIPDEAKSESEVSIKTYLCTPTEGTGGNNDLVYCVNKIYRFSIAIAAIASVFFLVIAGYLRMASDGSDDMVKQSTSIIVSVVAGNIILAFGYVFLRQINPEIIRIKAPVIKEIYENGLYNTLSNDMALSLERFNGGFGNLSGNGVTGTGGGGSGGGSCTVLTSGYCTVDNMKRACSSWNPEAAARICNLESGGGRKANIASGVDKCSDGTSFSYGFWQFNLTVHQGQSYMPAECRTKMFEGLNRNCRVVNREALNACVNALQSNIDVQTKAACGLYAHGGFKHWVCSAQRCRVPGYHTTDNRCNPL